MANVDDFSGIELKYQVVKLDGLALQARRNHVLLKAHNETNPKYGVIWMGVADKVGRHASELGLVGQHVA